MDSRWFLRHLDFYYHNFFLSHTNAMCLLFSVSYIKVSVTVKVHDAVVSTVSLCLWPLCIAAIHSVTLSKQCCGLNTLQPLERA